MSSQTERHDWIIATALFVAARSLRSGKNPPWSDIADMEQVLSARYSGYKAALEFQNDLRVAWRMGFRPAEGESINHEGVRSWLRAHPASANLVALFDELPASESNDDMP